MIKTLAAQIKEYRTVSIITPIFMIKILLRFCIHKQRSRRLLTEQTTYTH